MKKFLIPALFLTFCLVAVGVEYKDGIQEAIRTALYSSSGKALTVDPDSGTLVMIDQVHYELHEGSAYFIKTWQDVSDAGTVTRFDFTTPTNGVTIHAKALISAEAEFTIEIWEGATFATTGTVVNGVNNNRNSTNEAIMVAHAGSTFSSTNQLIWASKVGSGRNDTGVAPGLNYEIVAKTNTTYVFVVTKEASGEHWLDVDFFWYEAGRNGSY